MIIKKWFSILLLLGFIAPMSVYAYDDDEEDWEEEYETPKKAVKKAKAAVPKKAKSESDAPSRVGLYTGFGGAPGTTIGIVYDMGNDIQFGLGVGLNRRTLTPYVLDTNTTDVHDDYMAGEAETVQTWTVSPVVIYRLGKGLLGYGLSLGATISGSTEEYEDGVTNISVTPSFYVSAALVPNVVLSLGAGIRADILGEIPEVRESGLNLQTTSSVLIIFYFM